MLSGTVRVEMDDLREPHLCIECRYSRYFCLGMYRCVAVERHRDMSFVDGSTHPGASLMCHEINTDGLCTMFEPGDRRWWQFWRWF